MNQFNEKGKQHGPWEGYWNSTLIYKGTYINGIKHGQWEWHNVNTNLKIIGIYNNGEENRYFEQYYDNINHKVYYI